MNRHRKATALAATLGAAVLGSAWLFLAAAPVRVDAPAGIRGFAAARVAHERELEQKLQQIPDADHSEKHLQRLTAEPHMAGTEASHRVAEWLRDQYRSYGFDSDIVSYSVWLPQPVEVKLELIEPERKALATPEAPFKGDKDTYDKRAVVGFNTYSPSSDVTAPVVYVNYGMTEDYEKLAELGVNVEGRVVIARYGRGYRGIKAKLAEEHKAAALLLYSDPADDGYAAGDPYPQGPWRPMTGIQRGSILYTEVYPGDPLTPGTAATQNAKRLAPNDAPNLPRIPALPINAQDAAAILPHLDGVRVPREWQGGLPFSYHVGPGQAKVHLKLVMDYKQRNLYDVIAKLHGTSDDEWVLLGNHHDAWVFGAADPSSGTAVMLETARALGELARSGWKPRRTIVMCHWDGEEPGLLGSVEWVEDNLADLRSKAVAYINVDVGVTGPNFGASAVPSLKEFVREVTRDVTDPQTGRSVYDAWKARVARGVTQRSGTARDELPPAREGDVPLGNLGAGSDFCPFFDHAGIPSIDVGSGGDYGVYHALYDDFYWMKHFGDPTFAYHAEMARIMGTMALRLDEADLLPFDYAAYASEIEQAVDTLENRAKAAGDIHFDFKAASDAAAELTTAASHARVALAAVAAAPPEAARAKEMDRALVTVEQALLAPDGFAGRPWYKHTIYAPGSYAGYAAVVMPGVSEAIDRRDAEGGKRELASLAAALRRAAAQLDEVPRLAKGE